MDEQQRTDDLVRTWMSLFLPQRDASTGRAGQGAMARPNGLMCSSMLVRSVREKDREVDWVASTLAVDSYDTVIEQDWEGEHGGLDRYRANPVVLFAHDSRSLPIGRALKIGVENPGKKDAALVTTVKFATEKANPMAELCWQSVLEDTLRGMSVGWLPGGTERREIDGVMRTVFIRNSLYELSVCPVPSNPEALSRAMQRAFGGRGQSYSFPIPALGDLGSLPGGAGRALTTPSAAGAAANPSSTSEKKPMATPRTFIIDNHGLDQVRRLGSAEIKDGDDTFRVAIPGLTEVDVKARSHEERATQFEKRIVELTTQLDAANKRATDAETAKQTAETAKQKAEKERSEAVAQRASIELAPLTGLDPWQFTPAERDHVASLAATNPEAYKRMVEERTDKGVKVGALSRQEPRSHLPTSKGDPTPRDLSGTPAPGTSLLAQAQRAVDAQDAQNTAAD